MPSGLLTKVALGTSVAVGLYGVILGLLLTPSIQRFAVYANYINTLFLDNLHDPRKYGFAKNQVTPFNIRTPDGERLFAWHVLPIDAYTRNEEMLRQQNPPESPWEDVTSTTAFQLLTSTEPEPARVVISFHGNAGHVAQGWRADMFRQLTSLPNTHVLTVDYRGFGHSTGSPTEAGLIADGTALVNWVVHVAKIPPERIVILGQSLGTAVSSAVALRFVDPGNELIPVVSKETHALVGSLTESAPMTFAGVVLVAPFFSLPSLMLTYRIGGILPLLLPLRFIPGLADALTATMVDQWPTADRLAAYYRGLSGHSKLKGPHGRNMGTLQILHALKDFDISFHQTEEICKRITDKAKACVDGSSGPDMVDLEHEGNVRLRFEILEYGGHNRIVTYSPVMSAISRAFDDLW